jgi:general secretion pathway protein E
MKFYKGVGCDKCSGLGYKGRVGLYEVIINTPEIQKLIVAPEVIDRDIEIAAAKSGMILMLHDGILKALDGDTTVEEVFRVAK